jgi:dCMP deaminase
MASQKALDKAYIDIAYRWAEMSKARRLKVGCIVVKDGQIISDGFNGMPSGFDNNCEDELYTYDERDIAHERHEWKFNAETNIFHRLKTKPEVIHAESNALMKLARSTNSSVGSTMYITHDPCFPHCSKLIIQAGIIRVVYATDYTPTREGIDLLRKAGIIVEKI